MQITYSKNSVYTILRFIGYFLLWGAAVHLIIFVILKNATNWSGEYIFHHPLLSPLNGLKLWLAAGTIYGFIHRKRKKGLTFKSWGRVCLYMLIFGAFLSSLQIYYVHRLNTGWYDMASGNKCMNKYHSFWLIDDKTYFQGIDNCLKSMKAQELDKDGKPKYIPIYYTYNSAANAKTEFIDDDTITPRILWILIAFSLVTIIELFRRFGAIALFNYVETYVNYWKKGMGQFNKKNAEEILLGAIVNLFALFFLPKIDGYPSAQLPLILFIACIFISFRLYLSKGLPESPATTGFPSQLMVITGVIFSSLLLTILGVKTMYYLLGLSLIAFMILINKAPGAALKILIFSLLFFDIDFLIADDGTWSSGGLDTLLNDTAGPLAVNNVETLTDSVLPVIPFAVIENPEETEEFVPAEDVMGTGIETTATDNNPGDENPGIPIDRPLGEDTSPVNPEDDQ